MRPIVFLLVAVAALPALPVRADAYDFTVDSATALQVYDVTGPGGAPELARRRILQTLRLGAYNFILPRPGGPRLSVVLGMRLDSDFGIESEELDTDELRTAYLPGLERHDVDLTYGWIDGQGLLAGWLGFRAGRQFVIDSLGWHNFDGALLRVTTPFWLQVEGYAGVEVRGGNPLSPSTFELDGVQRAPREGLDPTAYPTIEEPALARVVGAALETTSLMWVHGRLSFRDVASEGRTQERRLGYSASVTPIEPLTVRGSVVWDVHLSFVSEVTGGAEVEVADPLILGAELVHFTPTFDADSIWNFFPIEPMNDLRLRAQVKIADGLDLSAMGFGRLFSAPDSEKSDGDESVTDLGGAVALRGGSRVAEISARLHGSDGEGGLRLGSDLWAMRRLWNDRFGVSARLSLWRWHDELRIGRNGTTFGYVLGGQYRISRPASLTVELEHDINEVAGNRLRLLALLDLRFIL